MCVCVYAMEYYSAFKKEEILQYVTTWMHFEDIMVSEISHAERDKYNFTYMWSLKKTKQKINS